MPQLLLGFTTVFWLTILSLLPFTILSVDADAWGAALAPGALSSGILAVYAKARGFARLRAPAEILLFHLLLLLPVAASAYISMQLRFPLADDQLAKMDATLGFDWSKKSPSLTNDRGSPGFSTAFIRPSRHSSFCRPCSLHSEKTRRRPTRC